MRFRSPNSTFPKGQIEINDHWLSAPGGRLFVRTWEPPAGGDRSPIVVLHDSLGCVELWRSFPAALAARTNRTVAAYDRLGFGRSDPHPGRLGLDFIAAEATVGIQRVVEFLGIDRWIGLGHSVGGGMVVCAAARIPGCVATVTEAAQAFVEQRTIHGIRSARDDFARPGQIDRLERYHGAKARWVLEAWTETWLDPAFAQWSLDAALVAVANPVLAIHGELDE